MNKTIAVIAANGRSGKVFVEAALEAGYAVRAGYHGANNLSPHQNLVTIKCDATNEEEVTELLDGADIVVSLIGHGKDSPASVQTDSMKVLAKVMNGKGITRIISLTGTGVRLPGDTPSLIDRFMNMSIKLIDPNRIDDGIAHAEFLQTTNLNWTVLRVLKLTDGPTGGAVQLSLSGPAEVFTSRSRVATAILCVIDDSAYDRKMPIIQGSDTST